jgi:DNA-binding winged helix-turn-helix (wHTH) protein
MIDQDVSGDGGRHTTESSIVRFGDAELDVAKAELRRAGRELTLSALSLSLLEYLVRHHDRVVTHKELLAAVWRGVTVTEASLRRATP